MEHIAGGRGGDDELDSVYSAHCRGGQYHCRPACKAGTRPRGASEPGLADLHDGHAAVGLPVILGIARVGALERLGGEPAVREVALFGSALHVTVPDAAAAAAPVRAALEAAGIRVDRVEPIPPSLEDVFVSLIESQARAAAPAARA